MYSKDTEQLLSKEFPTLQDNCYLDHTGATLYARSQITAISKDLCENIYGNPHSLSLSSRYCTDVIDQVRYRVLQHFNTNSEEYSVIFTSGATGALKLVAESFDWKGGDCVIHNSEFQGTEVQTADDVQHVINQDKLDFPTQSNQEDINIKNKKCGVEEEATTFCKESKSTSATQKYNGNCGAFLYLRDNHTSVLGMREFAADRGALIQSITHDQAFETFGIKDAEVVNDSHLVHCGNSLFVYPAQCNFSGVKYPLWWINKVEHGILDKITNLNDNRNTKAHQRSKWFCLLDAATYVSTNVLDLSVVKPDFVCISFYKMFGYPTGLGALLVRNSSAGVLKKMYFGGGTVLISLSSERFHISRPALSDRFEDGTIPFLSIIALRHGFDALERLTKNMHTVTLHTFSLARFVHRSLLLLHHENGSPVAVLYSDTDYEDFCTQGNIVNFNLLRSTKEYIGFMEVLNMANLYGIHLRTGCFCNPGACQRHLGLSVEELRSHFQAGHVCGDERDLIDGRPTGSIRISFGYMSTQRDADKLLDMITTCFVDAPKVVKVPQWWPSFRKNYRDKFATECSKNSLIDLTSNVIFQKNDEDFTLGNSFISNIPVNQSKELLHKTSVNDILIMQVNVNDDVEPNRNEKLSDNGIQYEMLDNIETQLTVSNNVCEHGIDQDDSNDTKKMNDSCNVESVLKASEHTEFVSIYLSHIFVYPVKSCGAMPVKSWMIGPRGLVYDREWMIVTPSGVSLTQKQETKLCLIQPTINLHTRQMILDFPGLPSICLPLDRPDNHSTSNKQASLCQSKVCGDRVQCWDCGDEVAVWLNLALSREGLQLIRQWDSDQRIGKYKRKNTVGNTVSDEKQPILSLSNQAQFLLLNEASVQWLGDRLEEETDCSRGGLLERFRSNLVVHGLQPFNENDWSKLLIGNIGFCVDGPCTRCQMICIDQATGERTREPLRTLSAAFHGKMRFGIYLKHQWEDKEMRISVGDKVVTF